MADSSPKLAGEEKEKTCWQCGRSFVTAMEVCPDDGARLIETDLEDEGDPLVGTVFDGRFQISAKLGEGGMGSVYSARKLDFETDVALKLLKLDFATDDGIRKRFMYEARVISNLKHPHAIRLFDFGQADDGHVYMVMELLDGESLADRLGYRFVSYREVFDIIPPICGVLGEAHLRDVIHRDLKPENIFLLEVEGNEEFPKLLDFGIAKHKREATMTKSGTLWGTPAYMSPEQARGDSVGPAADIYGIGIMLFELISGNLPFHASTQMGYAVKHINEPVRPLSSIPGLQSVPEELDEYISTMLAKRPEDRPDSMKEVASTLERIRDEQFDDALLDSVPAEEVDPIGLQRWIKDAPDVSQELEAEAPPTGGDGERDSPTVVADEVPVPSSDGDAGGEESTRALAQTAAMAETTRARVDSQALDEAREAERPDVTMRSDDGEAPTRRVDAEDDADVDDQEGGESRSAKMDGGDVESGSDDTVARAAMIGTVVALAALVGILVLTTDDEEIDREIVTHQEAEPPPPQQAEVEPELREKREQIRSSARSEALDVVFEARVVIQRIEGDDEEDFDFVHDVSTEGGEGEPESDEDPQETLRDALEQTF